MAKKKNPHAVALGRMGGDPPGSQGLSSSAIPNGQVPESDPLLPPRSDHVGILQVWQKTLKERGPVPSDLQVLDGVYHNSRSEIAQALRFYFTGVLELLKKDTDHDKKAVADEHKKWKNRLVELLASAIREARGLAKCDNLRAILDFEKALLAFPPPCVLDLAERYRCANDRRRTRYLQDLEIVRRLMRRS